VSTFKEVQLLQTKHHGANCIKVRHTERKFNIRTYHTFTGRPRRLLHSTDAISANVARELHNYSNRESVTAWMCTSGRCSGVRFVLAYTSGILDFSILTAFHTLSLLHFPLLHFPPLLSTPAFSTLAFSTPAFSAPPLSFVTNAVIRLTVFFLTPAKPLTKF